MIKRWGAKSRISFTTRCLSMNERNVWMNAAFNHLLKLLLTLPGKRSRKKFKYLIE